MADAAHEEVIGADTFARNLHTAAAGLEDLSTASRATGDLIRGRAAGRAPKRSGRLASSLTVRASGSDVEVSSALVYAGVIHYGWAAHGISANPFLVPAATDSETVWIGFYESDIQSKLDKVRGA